MVPEQAQVGRETESARPASVRVVRRTRGGSVVARPSAEDSSGMQTSTRQPCDSEAHQGRGEQATDGCRRDLSGMWASGRAAVDGSDLARASEVRGKEKVARLPAPEARGPLVSAHALIRWVHHYGRRSGLAEQMQAALSALAAELDEAREIKTLDTGATLVRGPRPRRARFIVRDGVVVTVLDLWDGRR